MLKRVALVMCLVTGSVSVGAQEAALVDADAPGVSPLRFVTYVPVEYPQIALAAAVAGEVVLRATIGVDGVPRDMRVLKSIPLLDMAAIDGVKRWRFESPLVQGKPVPVSAIVRLTFRYHSGLSSPLVPAVRSASLPQDFSVVFASNCPGGGGFEFNTGTGTYLRTWGRASLRVALWLDAEDLEGIHHAIVKADLLSQSTELERWPDQPPPPQMSGEGIDVWVQGHRAHFNVVTDAPTPRQYVLDVRINGTWTRLSGLTMAGSRWPEVNQKIERRVRPVTRLIEKLVQSDEAVRQLPRAQRWCSWPN